MTRKLITRSAPAIALATLGIAWAGASWAQEPGAGQKVGTKLDNAVQDLKGGLNRAGEAVKDRYAQAKTSASNLGVEARIYSRLQWDKALNNSSVELTAGEPGVFVLSGQVVDLAAKKRAVDLTETTVGVTRVVDQLSIRPEGTVTTPAPLPSGKTARPVRP